MRLSRPDPEITRTLLERLAVHVGLEVYVLHRVVDQGSALELASHAGVPADSIPTIERLALGEPGGGPTDDGQHAADVSVAALRSLGLRAHVCHPLLAAGRLLGTLVFGTTRRSRFESGELELIKAVSDHVALTLDHERLLGTADIQERLRIEEEHAAIQAREHAARVEAEDANRARDEFLAVLSHELRTPLNVMLGWVRMLRSSDVDPVQAAHALQVIERNIRAQTDLINDLVDVSRIVSGTLVLDLRPVDLLPIVQAAIDGVRPAADVRNLTLESALGESPLPTVGDGTRLRQVVSQLLTNAVKFTPEGGGVTIRLHRIGDRARLSVSDSGEGIAPELLPHIFDRYRARDRGTRRPHSGLGLGLTIVRRVVELHGGSIEAASAGLRRGATFTVELPLRRPDRESHSIGVSPREEPADERLDLLRILVVDDDLDTCELLSVVLKERGATVVTARSVMEAHRLLTRFAPDVVLSDISMPGEDGFRMLDWVKQSAPPSRPIPVIALTAHARAEDRHQILAAGFKGYLSKPLDVSDIVRVTRSVTGRGPRA